MQIRSGDTVQPAPRTRAPVRAKLETGSERSGPGVESDSHYIR